jgi:predicted DNA-binding protein YlxM (UPF0122 family)
MNEMTLLISDGLTDNQTRFINAFVSSNCNISQACEKAEISRQTFYHWGRESDKFAQAVEQVKEGLKDRIEQEIFRHIFEDRNPIVLNKFAPSILKDRGYADSKDINLSGDMRNDNEVVITIVDNESKLEDNQEV